METSNYDQTARAALFDNEAWQALAAQDPQALLTWCIDTIGSIQTQLSSRRATWEAFCAVEQPNEIYRAEKARYLGWRSRANRFRTKCEERRRHLRASIQEVRRLDHVNMYKQALFKLAAAVDDHEHGTITLEKLCGILDNLEVPIGTKGDTTNLMDAVDAWRDYHATPAPQAA